MKLDKLSGYSRNIEEKQEDGKKPQVLENNGGPVCPAYWQAGDSRFTCRRHAGLLAVGKFEPRTR
jgi:hypothetical protein